MSVDSWTPIRKGMRARYTHRHLSPSDIPCTTHLWHTRGLGAQMGVRSMRLMPVGHAGGPCRAGELGVVVAWRTLYLKTQGVGRGVTIPAVALFDGQFFGMLATLRTLSDINLPADLRNDEDKAWIRISGCDMLVIRCLARVWGPRRHGKDSLLGTVGNSMLYNLRVLCIRTYECYIPVCLPVCFESSAQQLTKRPFNSHLITCGTTIYRKSTIFHYPYFI